MKTCFNSETAVRIAAGLVLAGLAFGGAGCATTGGAPGEASSGATASASRTGKGDFYADWYDASAVVLPPPAQAAAR